MSSRNAPFSPSVWIFRGTKLLTMQVGHSEVKWKSAHAKCKSAIFSDSARERATSQLANIQLESRAMPDTLRPSKTEAAATSQSPRLFGWPRQVAPAERKSLLAGGFGWML